MKYIVATTEGQPKNSSGGRNYVKVSEITAVNVAAAKQVVKKKFGKNVAVMTPSEWEFLSRRDII